MHVVMVHESIVKGFTTLRHTCPTAFARESRVKPAPPQMHSVTGVGLSGYVTLAMDEYCEPASAHSSVV